MTASPPPASEAEGEPASSDDRRVRWVLIGVGAAFVIGVTILIVTERTTSISKPLILPFMLAGAAAIGRAKRFVRDWVVFLASVVLFDAFRGFIFGLINQFKLPVYMMYAIDAEYALFGQKLSIIAVQESLAPDGKLGWLERGLGAVYASHFVVFLLFGLLIWMVKPERFSRYKASLTMLMYSGVILYLVVPTVPPWMADSVYHVIPPLQNFAREIFQNSLPVASAAFATNPIAAMPSLHCAFPTLLSFIAVREFGVRGLPMVLYTPIVYLSTVHLAQHYIVDVLGGIVIAVASYAAAYRSTRLAALLRLDVEPSADAAALRIRVLISTLIIVVVIAMSFAGAAMAARDGEGAALSAEFIARELDGRSPVASLYKGRLAQREKRYVDAKQWYEEAIRTAPTRRALRDARSGLMSAFFHMRDFQRTLQVARQFEALGPKQTILVGEALIRTGAVDDGYQMLLAAGADPRARGAVVRRLALLQKDFPFDLEKLMKAKPGEAPSSGAEQLEHGQEAPSPTAGAPAKQP